MNRHQQAIGTAVLAAFALLAPSFAQAQSFVERTGRVVGDDFVDSEWLCTLTGVAGSFNASGFDGGKQFVKVEHDEGLRKYFLVPSPKDNGRMACTRLNNFRRPAGSVFMRDNFKADVVNVLSGTDTTNMFFGDAFSMIHEMAGEFQSSKEYVSITHSTDPRAPSTIKVRVSDNATNWPADTSSVRGIGHSIFMGNPSSHVLPKMIGYTEAAGLTRGTAATNGVFEFQVSTQSGFSGYWMAHTSPNLSTGGFCYFTALYGDFNDTGESASIVATNHPSSGQMWFLSVARTGGGNGVFARARCAAYDQR